MREDGTLGDCIFPTIGLCVWKLSDPEVGAASRRIYNGHTGWVETFR